MSKATTSETKHSIVTTGDVVLDRFIYAGDRMLPEEKGSVSPVLRDSLGGAYMLHQLIEECVTKEQSTFGVKVTVEELKKANLLAYSLWQSCPGGMKDEKKETGKKPDNVWRVEKSLGYDLWQGKAPIREKAEIKTPCSALVIDDAGLGFRDHLSRDVWPLFGTRGASITPEWVILKMGRPLAEGDLWRALCARNAEAAAVRKKLVLVTSAAELRRAGAAFSSGFSWERTLGELCREMKQHARLRILLANTRHLVVNFGCEASVWFDNNPEAIDKGEPLVNHVRLVYDPSMAEGQWATQLADCDLKAEHAVYGHLNTVVAANGYMWLQYLLAPMQDGSFQDNGHIHPIGKCIFVFAGATSWDFEHFGPAPMPDDADKAAMRALKERYDDEQGLQQADQAALADFRRKKGPDFMSRLDGHINVLGPNQRMLYCWEDRAWTEPDRSDITFPVRRAILLRAFLGAKKGPLSIDRDLFRAFLQTPRYRYGACSLEKIALALAPTRKPFQRAMLPPPQVLEQHLDTAEAFDAIYHANRDFLIEENLWKMAAAIDENYSRHTNPTRPHSEEAEFLGDFQKKIESSDPWQQWLAATNIAAARCLPDILALVGLELDKGCDANEEIARVSAYLAHHLDTLAQEEHDQWVDFHLANGWRQADDKKLKELKILKDGFKGLEEAQKRCKELESATSHSEELTNFKRECAKMEAAKKQYKEEITHLKKDHRIHTLLVPFEDLDEKEKGKDHDAITNYPETVSLVGWKIVFTKP